MVKTGRAGRAIGGLLLGVFSVMPTVKAELNDPIEHLSDYLVSQGFDNFTAVGNHPPVEGGYVFKRVECLTEINRCRVIAENLAPGAMHKARYYWYRVNSQQLGWQTVRVIRKGETVSSADFKWGMTDSLVCMNRLAASTDLERKPVVMKRLKVGTSLCEYDLQKADDVSKGGLVTLTSLSETFELSIRVKALESGNRGDAVQVRLPGSGTILNGVVTAAGKVELIR